MICLSCGRKLKSEASVEAGYGPVCYRKIFGVSLKKIHKEKDLDTGNIPYYNIPGQMTMEEYLHTDLV